MMKRFLFIIPFFLFLSACILDNPKVKISNNSEIIYDSIKVFPSFHSPILFEDVKPKDIIEGRLLFEEKVMGDGGYHIQLFKGGKMLKQRNFGYYTNGASLDNGFKIIIEQDTILISNNYYIFP